MIIKLTKTKLLVFSAVIILILLLIQGPKTLKKQDLINTYNKVNEFADKNDSDSIYLNYFTAETKSQMSLNEYRNRINVLLKATSHKWIIHNVNVNGDKGFVDSTEQYCFKNKCSDSKYETLIGKVFFVYIDNHWLLADNQNQCDRTTPYEMPNEFSRAISIITQRFSESYRSEDKEFAKGFNLIKNCLDIKYASNQEEMEGIDGMFVFSKASPRNHLEIYVSPKYQVKDDLVTALTLSHELYHAFLRASGNDIFTPCFDNEANAFIVSYNFYNLLNEEEKTSLNARLLTRSSEEVYSFFKTYYDIVHTPAGSFKEQFNNYVKTNPGYIEECQSSQ